MQPMYTPTNNQQHTHISCTNSTEHQSLQVTYTNSLVQVTTRRKQRNRDKRLTMLVTYQQKHLEKETAEDRDKRLRTLVTNQQKRLETETAEERDKRLKVLLTNQQKRLEK